MAGVLALGTALPSCASDRHPAATVVGDPSNPAGLPSAIVEAYLRGARDISVKRGHYVLPATGKNCIELIGWKDATIRFNGSTIVFEETMHRPLFLTDCIRVTIENATLQFSGVSYTQGRIQKMDADTEGHFVDWQVDAGYPEDFSPGKATYNVIDQNTRLLKVGTGDYGAKQATTLVVERSYRLHGVDEIIKGASVGDWLVCRAPGGTSIIQLDRSKECTLRQLDLKNSGFAAFFETGGEGAHHYVDCRVSRGPKPQGASEEQLIACGADGFHSTGTHIGPTIERCVWEGVFLDDCIAIHGSLQTILSVDGNKMILEGRNHAGIAVGEPLRMSSRDGFIEEAKCVGIRSLEAETPRFEITLDRTVAIHVGAKAGNPERCGKSYRIIDCSLGNTRSRGILVKGDNGLIRGCHISGCGMSAISIGPEYYWNEGNYCWNVIVAENHLRNNSLRNNRNGDGVIFVHGDGARGNRNVLIIKNKFEENYCPYMMNIEWAEGVKIIENIIDTPSPWPLSEAGFIVNLNHVHEITIKANTYRLPGPSVKRAIMFGDDVERVDDGKGSGMKRIGK